MAVLTWTLRKLIVDSAPFAEFQHASPGIRGLAWEPDLDTLYLLAILSETPGHGCFRAFIQLAQRAYRRLGVLDLWNRDLARALECYGFQPFELSVYPEDPPILGLLWTR